MSQLRTLVAAGGIVVLSGAGISTDSGIPDYRGPDGTLRSRLPMTIRDFTGSPEGRRRYWARSQVGWQRIAAARPNPNHRAVAALQRAGLIDAVITQNVDGLHQKAGSPMVIDLHGNLDRVICLNCGDVTSRQQLDERLRQANPGALTDDAHALSTQTNPDGDVELDDEAVQRFTLVDCEVCGSDMLKPDVVFFGENVPKPRVQECFTLVSRARALLVLGSSLTVMSGLRFVKAAARDGIPVVIVNQGVTRGDPEATLKVDAPLAEVLPDLTARLAARSS